MRRSCQWLNGGVCEEGRAELLAQADGSPKGFVHKRGFLGSPTSVRRANDHRKISVEATEMGNDECVCVVEVGWGVDEQGDRKALYVQKGTSEECGDLAPTGRAARELGLSGRIIRDWIEMSWSGTLSPSPLLFLSHAPCLALCPTILWQ